MSEQSLNMAIFIARLNIDHFKRKLAAETSEPKRTALVKMLAEEEAKLATLLKNTEGDQETA
jgi:hypothetical protein